MHVKSDLHVHTNLSSCGDPSATLDAMAAAGKRAGLDVIGISNHLWDGAVAGSSSWYAPQDVAHVLRLREEMAAVTSPRILLGCEAEYTGGSTVSVSLESAALFDYILIPFTHLHMKDFVIPSEITEPQAVTAFMLARGFELMEHPLTTCGTPLGFAHPFLPSSFFKVRSEILAAISTEQYRRFFTRAAEKQISIEIHGAMTVCSRDEYLRMLSTAKACGCRFHFASDAHAPKEMTAELYAALALLAEDAGIGESDLWTF